jgi:hypothetical protein
MRYIYKKIEAMEFDNGKDLYRILRVELIGTIVFGATFSVSFIGVYKNSYLPLEGYHYALIILFIFGLLSAYWYGLKHSYFAFNSTNQEIVIKYFRMLPKFIKPKPKMVKIPRSTYVKYTIETSMMGKRKALYLFQRTKKGVVKYPPIYITSLNTNELELLKRALHF